ncbi:glutathione synthetase-like isoform X1 [Lucilia cuprina]|uniref:glutathione synthetase-like isoform X1 n=1 Tax=Lucilia cuprina TaxID=7375 RepID=UPI001F062D7E|nr:glutathione synthetase-like isoform X1 [Lucilia cuprina]XP_046802518.1 glutathione synthetase-like isoform X1 [Lucilia cuprina]
MSENPTLEECISIPIPEPVLLEVTEKAKDWAIMHGAAMRSKTNFSPDSLNFAPFLLTPSSFPRKEFEKAVALQVIINRLMHNVAHDEEFLTTTLAETIKVDEFTGNLFNIYKKVLANGFGQRISLGILRSDLMLESRCKDLEKKVKSEKPCAFCCWKQVEINTIASGFGHLGPASKAIQSYVLGEMGQYEKLKNMPENKALSGICDGMIRAWEIYNNPNAVIMFIIEDVSYNICDQRFHEFYIREKCPHIKVLRRTLTQVHDHGKLSLKKELIVEDYEVAVIYFRAGYEPGHYHSQNEWDARYLMECSTAIKCPSIHYHLAGTKKVQQALAEPEMLERFINDPEEIKAVGKIFTGLYSLEDNDVGNATYEMALKEPERFVLKPQREGGGNNVYGLDIPDVLRKMTRVERSAWILMDLIQPPVTKGYMIRPGGPMPPPVVDVVSELGIFGVIIGDVDNIICNYQAGHMLRTKISTANEGGVAAGLGALDSPYLVD